MRWGIESGDYSLRSFKMRARRVEVVALKEMFLTNRLRDSLNTKKSKRATL